MYNAIVIMRFVLILNVSLQLLFRPPLEMYDLIIHLSWKQSPRQHESVDQENSQLPSNVRKYVKKVTEIEDRLQHFPVYDYDPPRLYLNELKVTEILLIILLLHIVILLKNKIII